MAKAEKGGCIIITALKGSAIQKAMQFKGQYNLSGSYNSNGNAIKGWRLSFTLNFNSIDDYTIPFLVKYRLNAS